MKYKKGVQIMITKERLQELIEEGATVYLLKKNEIESIRLTDNHYIKEPLLIVDIDPILPFYEQEFFISDLYEHKADAEWDLEFRGTRYTEEMPELPFYRSCTFLIKYPITFYRKGNLYEFKVVWGEDRDYISIKNLSALRDYLGQIYYEVCTEQNYKEACRLIKKLFMGEE